VIVADAIRAIPQHPGAATGVRLQEARLWAITLSELVFLIPPAPGERGRRRGRPIDVLSEESTGTVVIPRWKLKVKVKRTLSDERGALWRDRGEGPL